MPLRIIADPGDTSQRAISSGGSTDWDAIHGANGSSATLGTEAGANSITFARKSGSNYFIIRGVIAYDFRSANAPKGIRVVRAHLHVGGTTVNAADTNGDKLRVGVITDPTIPGVVSIKKTDYDLSRYDNNSYTSAQAVANGQVVRGPVVQLDNSRILKHLTSAINNRGVLHLGLRNELDFLDDASDVTGTNRVWFAPPGLQGGSFHVSTRVRLNIFYRIVNNRRNPGGRGAGGVASSGFGGVSMFSGTNSGFSN